MSNGIEQWAARWAGGHGLSDAGWRTVIDAADAGTGVEWPDGIEFTAEQCAALRDYARGLWDGLSWYHQKTLERTHADWCASPLVRGRKVAWATMALLRDRHEIVEDGLGCWRTTPKGRACLRAGRAYQKSGPGASTHGPSEPGGEDHARPRKQLDTDT